MLKKLSNLTTKTKFTLALLAAGAAYFSLSSPLYESSAIINLKSLDSKASNLGSLILPTTAPASTELFSLKEYLGSYSAFTEINSSIDLKEISHSQSRSLDTFLNKLRGDYGLFKTYLSRMSIDYLQDSASLKINFQSHNPIGSLEAVESMLDLSENWVNKLNQSVYSATFSSYEGAVEGTYEKLEAAKQGLLILQKKQGSLDSEADAKSFIELSSNIKAQLVLAETELAAKRRYLSPTSSELNELNAKVAELKSQANKFNSDKAIGALAEESLAIREAKSDIVFLEKELESIKALRDEALAKANSMNYKLVTIAPAIAPVESMWQEKLKGFFLYTLAVFAAVQSVALVRKGLI